jgi:hypothetical protein
MSDQIDRRTLTEPTVDGCMAGSKEYRKFLNAFSIGGARVYDVRALGEGQNTGDKVWYHGPSLDAAVDAYNRDGVVRLHLVATTPDCVVNLVPRLPSPFGAPMPSEHDALSVDEVIASLINTPTLREQFDKANRELPDSLADSELLTLTRASLSLLQATLALLETPGGPSGYQAQALAQRISSVLANHLAQSLLA